MKYRIKTTYSIQKQEGGDVRWFTVRDRLGDPVVFDSRAEATEYLEHLKPRYRVAPCLCKWNDGKISAGYRIEIKQGRRWYVAQQDEMDLIFPTEEQAYETLSRLEEA